MESTVSVHQGSKEEEYSSLLPQLKALIDEDVDSVSNMANVAAALRTVFGFFWVGFYRIKDETLHLAPFQGPVACTKIEYGKGVCGTCWEKEKTIIVDDVDDFPGHIACSSDSRSEIVVPIFKKNRVVAVLDVDSDKKATFDATDQKYLEAIAQLLS